MAEQCIIKVLTPELYSQWDAFIDSHKDGTLFHLSLWKEVIEQTFGHKCYFLYALENDKITGVLPLGHTKSLLFGNALTSIPFAVYGGVVADSEQVANQLEEYACQLAKQLSVDYLELRNLTRRHPEWPYKDLYVCFRKAIADNDEENLQSIPRKQRAMVRKGIKANLESVIEQDVEQFYRAYSESVRNLGTPVFPKRLFVVLKKVLADKCEILTITHNQQLISSVMSFYYKDRVMPYYGGGLAIAKNYKGNDFMYWRLMSQCVEKGVGVFDYGRSKKGTGSFSFKKNWGFTPQPLYYEYFLVNAKKMPDRNPLNPKYQIFIKCWRHLPLRVSQILGPLLSKYLD